jgi:hypothetical protein
MIEYIADFLGVSSDVLNTPFAYMLCIVFLAVFVYGLLKVILYWLDMFFGH